MPLSADRPVLFHYPATPYGEKVRLALGLKGIPWTSVEVPSTLPRPALMDLTGGYRRIPVMQIGAEIHCDTREILTELDRRFPDKPLVPEGAELLCHAAGVWQDRALFSNAVGWVLGQNADNLTDAWLADRSDMRGTTLERDGLRAAAPHAAAQTVALLHQLEKQLNAAGPYLMGDAPTLADIHIYSGIRFLRFAKDSAALVARHSGVSAWADRVAAIGYGDLHEATMEEAVALAAASTPSDEGTVAENDLEGLTKGDTVVVMPDDTGRRPVQGTLLHADSARVTIRRQSEAAGPLNLHVPRFGMITRAAEG